MTYTPNAGYHGPDSFTFKANDGKADSSIATVSIAVWSAQPDPLGRFSRFLPKANWVRFDFPSGITVGPEGSVYVANNGGHPVRVLDRNGNLVKKWGVWGNVDGGFYEAKGIALGPDGSVYVLDFLQVQKFDGNGNFITRWEGKDGEGGQFNNPLGIIAGPDGSVYVLDFGMSCIQKFDGNGNFLAKWGSVGNEDGQFSFPNGIAMGPDGYIYVADRGNFRIQKFDRNGNFEAKWGSYGEGDGQFVHPIRLAVGPDGSVHVWDDIIGQMQKFDGNGNFIMKWGGYGPGDGEFHYRDISGIAVGPDGSVYVSEEYVPRIQNFDADGAFIKKWTTFGSGDGQFNHAQGLAFGSDGSMFVIDSENNRVQKFDRDGNFLIKWGNYGNGNGQFKSPGGIAVGPDNSVYVADTDNKRIQKFGSNGNFIRKWGNAGSQDGQFSEPMDIAVGPDGSVYVADHGNDRIQKFDPEGNFISKWGTSGSGDGEFAWPHGIFVGPDGSVFVTEEDNDRVQKFDSVGNFIAKWGNRGSGDGEFENPEGVVLGFDGSIYVADSGNNRIQKFDRDGNFIMKWGRNEDGAFDFPIGMAISPDGVLYVIDSGNSSIVRMDVEDPQDGTITGRVIASSTNQPLDAATVTIEDLVHTFTTQTDESGTYTVRGMASGDFSATFMKSGYFGKTVTGAIIANETQNIAVQLSTAPPLILSIAKPQDGDIIHNYYRQVSVSGNVSEGAEVWVNGDRATRGGRYDTYFESTLYLVEGPNTITVTAQDQFGRMIYGQIVSRSIQVTLDNRAMAISCGQVVPGSIAIAGESYVYTFIGSANDAVTIRSWWTGGADFTTPYLELYGPTGSLIASSDVILPPTGEPAQIDRTLAEAGTYTILVRDYFQTDSFNYTLTWWSLLGPSISSIAVRDMMADSASVSWTTDQPADSRVEYGTTTSLGSSIADPALLTNHQITLSNLSSGTLYHYRVISTNSSGFTSASSDQTFSTASLPPVISNIAVTGITGASATVSWVTDQRADSLVEYGPTISYGNSVSDPTLSTSHQISLADLSPGTLYHYRITSNNSYGIPASSEDRTFMTDSVPSRNKQYIRHCHNGGFRNSILDDGPGGRQPGRIWNNNFLRKFNFRSCPGDKPPAPSGESNSRHTLPLSGYFNKCLWAGICIGGQNLFHIHAHPDRFEYHLAGG